MQGVVVLGCGAVIATRPTLDTIEEEELQVVRLHDFVSRQWSDLAWIHRLDQVGGYQDDQFLLDAVVRRIAEERSDDGQVTQPRDALRLAIERQLQQARDGQRLTLP